MLRPKNVTRISVALLTLAFSLGGELAAQTTKESGKGTAKDSTLQTAVAEGVGSTADEALKGAFRAAVQQVVGAVVSAETVVKNDEIIEDKILTFSDGFIDKYDEVPGSKTVKGGVHRIKIKAVVSQKRLIERLKAANIAMFKVDGSSLVAEAVSKLQVEKDASAMLDETFKGFPESCVKTSIVGKPSIEDKTENGATLVFKVQFEPDAAQYKAFQIRLTGILGKMAKQPDDFTAKFTPVKDNPGAMVSADEPRIWTKTMTAPDKKGNQKSNLIVAVATSQTKLGDRINYRYFPIDESLTPFFVAAASKAGTGKLQILDANNETIAIEDFSFEPDGPFSASATVTPNLVTQIFGHGPPCCFLITSAFAETDLSDNQMVSPNQKVNIANNRQRLLGDHFESFHRPFIFSNKIEKKLRVKLSHDEIAAISDVKVELRIGEAGNGE